MLEFDLRAPHKFNMLRAGRYCQVNPDCPQALMLRIQYSQDPDFIRALSAPDDGPSFSEQVRKALGLIK